MPHKTTIISLGGSLIIPKEVNVAMLNEFRDVITAYVKKGNRVVIICGGGSLARNYQQSATLLNHKNKQSDLDRLGISATRVNAELVRMLFPRLAYNKIILDPREVTQIKNKIIVGGGWREGASSDYVAVLSAQYTRSSELINLSNVAWVYDKDPKKYTDAKPIPCVTWKEMKKIVGTKWQPGKNVPFDPIASRLAEKLKLHVVLLDGNNIQNLKKYLFQQEVSGSVIS